MEAQTQPKTESLQERLTPEHAARFLFHSFRHSQGDPELQSQIFQHTHLLRPGWKIDAENKPKIRELATKTILAFLGRNGGGKKDVVHHTAGDPSFMTVVDNAGVSLKQELDIMEIAFNDPHVLETRDVLIQRTARRIIERDFWFLVKEKGRERSPADTQKPLMDPWLSFIVHFGLNRNPTGVIELDKMYLNVRAFVTKLSGERNFLRRPVSNGYWLKGFNDVLRIYKEKHPGTRIDLSP